MRQNQCLFSVDLLHRHEIAPIRLLRERHFAFDNREDRVIFAHADVCARVKLGAPLADDDIARNNVLAAVFLDAEAPAF